MRDSLSTSAVKLFALSRITFAIFLLVAATPATAQDAPRHSCVIIQELNAAQPLVAKGDGCSTRLSPASTFKIPHALVALETGAVTPDSIEKWDGTKYPRQLKWNQDHTVISALKPSVLWLFQRIAPRIGAARMTEWLAKFKYGNGEVSGPITEYWINGRLQVSVPEQVAFLREFYRARAAGTAAVPGARASRSGPWRRHHRELAGRATAERRLAAGALERQDRRDDAPRNTE